MTELKPCPFCGGKAEPRGRANGSEFHTHSWIECAGCGLKSKSNPDMSFVESSWNNRVQENPSEPIYECHAVHPGSNSKQEIGGIYIQGRTFWDWLAESEWGWCKPELLGFLLAVPVILVVAWVFAVILKGVK